MSVFSHLHRYLRIGDNYHQAEANAPRISEFDRMVALDKLASSGAIDDKDRDALLQAICKRLATLKFTPTERLRDWSKPIVNKQKHIVDAIMANPHGKSKTIAFAAKCSPDTVRRYRQQLRDEGII